jgi:hypothetical protein
VAVAAVGAVLATPAAAADPTGALDVTLVSGSGVVQAPGDWWYVHNSPFRFTASAANIGSTAVNGAVVFVSVPDSIALTGSGDGWSCAATGGGMDCTNHLVVQPGAKWPLLTVDATGSQWVQDTIDAYVQSTGADTGHDGHNFLYDTSA